jgi:hypothetical protein
LRWHRSEVFLPSFSFLKMSQLMAFFGTWSSYSHIHKQQFFRTMILMLALARWKLKSCTRDKSNLGGAGRNEFVSAWLPTTHVLTIRKVAFTRNIKQKICY